jgi:hypothetical protein
MIWPLPAFAAQPAPHTPTRTAACAPGSPLHVRISAGRHALVGGPSARVQALLQAAFTTAARSMEGDDSGTTRPQPFYEHLLRNEAPDAVW